MGQVLPFITQDSVNDAWESYAVLARQLSVDASLLADRAFNERLALAHEKWRRLYLRQGHDA